MIDANIITMLIELMKFYGSIKKLSGSTKKEKVLQRIEQDVDLSEIDKYLLSMLIDLLIDCENGDLTFNTIKNKFNCFK